MEEHLQKTQETGKTDAEWRQVLTPEQYRIMRQKGTNGMTTYSKTQLLQVYYQPAQFQSQLRMATAVR